MRKEIEGAGDEVFVLETQNGGSIDFELRGVIRIQCGSEVSHAVHNHVAQSHFLKDYIIHISVLIFVCYKYSGLDIHRNEMEQTILRQKT